MDTPPTNEHVASVFRGIADLLDEQGENPFKVKAYRNAVRTLGELNEPVAAIAARGELRQVPGFGEAITAKTGEILQTGTCELYEKLKAEREAQVTRHDEPEVEPGETAAPEDILSPW